MNAVEKLKAIDKEKILPEYGSRPNTLAGNMAMQFFRAGWERFPQVEMPILYCGYSYLWPREIPGTVEFLRSLGIERFYYCDESTGLMENLHAFAGEGVVFDGLVTIHDKPNYRVEPPRYKRGIRLRVLGGPGKFETEEEGGV